MKEIKLLDKLQDRAVKLIRNGNHRDLSAQATEMMRNITPLKERRKKHHLSLMYRLSRIEAYLENKQPEINLRSQHKIEFSIPATKLTKVLKSPFYRGVSLLDRLSLEVQRDPTKVRFKQLIT